MTTFNTEKRGKIYMVIHDSKDIGYAKSTGIKGVWMAVYCDKPLGIIHKGEKEACLVAIKVKYLA